MANRAVHVTVKGLPLAYNKDLQETQEPVFDAADTALACDAESFRPASCATCEFDFARMSRRPSADS